MTRTHDIREVEKLFARCKDQGEIVADRHRRVATINESFVQGDQGGSIVYRSGVVETRSNDWFDAEGLPRIFVNLLQPLRMVWTSLINASRVYGAAFPASDEPEDSYRATVAQKLLRFHALEEGTAGKVHRLAGQGFDAGTAALKVHFDPEEDRVRWSNASIFDYLIDPTPDFNDAAWCIFNRWVGIEEAEDLYKSAGFDSTPTSETRKNPAGEEIAGQVEAFELWHKPTRAHPRGLFAFIVGGRVVETCDFPYVFEDESGKSRYVLPIFVFKVRDVRGSAYGATNLTDAIPLQRTVNELNDRAVTIQRKTSGVHAWLPSESPEDWDPAIDSVLRYQEGQQGTAPQFLQPPPMNPALERHRDYFAAQIPSVIGLNEVSTGDDTSVRSGVALEAIFSLDKQKNADASKSFEEAVVGACSFTLKLMSRFYTSKRKVRITNDTSADVLSFDGSDIAGVDVRLEAGSEQDQRSDVRAAGTEAKVQAGTATPLDLQRATNAPGYGMSRALSEALISDFLEGREVDPKPGVDFDLAVFTEVIAKHKSRALSEGNKDDWVALAKLEREVADAAREQADTTPKTTPTPTEAPPAPEAT